MDFGMSPKAIGWTLLLNVLTSASASLRPFKIYDWTFEKEIAPVNHTNRVGPRIYNGMEAEEEQFTFMIFLMVPVGERISFCSSSLVTSSWVLTAGHCVNFPHRGRVIMTGGKANLVDYINERMYTDFDYALNPKTYGVQERLASTIHIHPKYDEKSYEHDVALLRANKPFNLGGRVTTIPLSTQKLTSRKLCTILGWGMVPPAIMPYKLNYVEGKEVSSTELGCPTDKEGQSFICLKPDSRGICQGDSGSPLVCEGKVWGVASHMEAPSGVKNNTCGNRTMEFYTEIYYDSEWISSHINGGHFSRNINLRNLLSCVVASVWISLAV